MKPQYCQRGRGGHHGGGCPKDRRIVRFSEPPRRGRVYKERCQPYRPPTPSQSGRGRPLQRDCPPTRTPKVCRFCKTTVMNLSAHNRKMHSMKFVGWECPRCKYFEAQADKSRFKRHLSLHHPSPGLEECLVQVHEGYMRPILCHSCDYQARNSLFLSRHMSQVHFVATEGPSQAKPEAGAQEEVVDRRIAQLQDTLQKRLEELGISNAAGQVTPKKDEAAVPSAPPPTPRRKTVDQRLAEMEAWVSEIQAQPARPVPPPTPPAQATPEKQVVENQEMLDIVAEAAAACELSLEDGMDTSSPAPPPPPVPLKVPMPEALLPGFAQQLEPLPPHPNLICGSPIKKKVKTFKLVERPDAPPPGSIHLVINNKGRMEDQVGEEVSSLSINK